MSKCFYFNIINCGKSYPNLKLFLLYMIKAMSTYCSTAIAKRCMRQMCNCEHMHECARDGARSNVINILNIIANSI